MKIWRDPNDPDEKVLIAAKALVNTQAKADKAHSLIWDYEAMFGDFDRSEAVVLHLGDLDQAVEVARRDLKDTLFGHRGKAWAMAD